MLNQLTKLKINGNNHISPEIENHSFVIIDRFLFFDLGIINYDTINNKVEIFILGKLDHFNESLSNSLKEKIVRDNKFQSIYLPNYDMIRMIFGKLKFQIIENENIDLNNIILIDSGMLLFGNKEGHIFKKNKHIKNYDYIIALLYNLIETYQDDFLEIESQLKIKIPIKILDIIRIIEGAPDGNS